MSALSRWFEARWWSDSPPPRLLQMLTPVYNAINQRNLKQRALRQQATLLPLISIGNITVGGSGKTPFTLWLARALEQRGMRPVILCRGDGGKADAPLWLDDATCCQQAGDEAVLLHRSTTCPVMTARNRVQACRIIGESGRGDVIILDDGFQYQQLQRCCDVVMIPAQGIGNGCLLPAGPLREATSALARADIIVRSSHRQPQGSVPAIGEQHEWLWLALPGQLCDWMKQHQPAPHHTALNVITGIARPERFFDNLTDLGHDIASRHIFIDHHRYSPGEVASLARLRCPVTTAKDAVKLMEHWPSNTPLWVLEQKVVCNDQLIDAIQAHITRAK
jgi:tetraacyldisaccharide 4'-kinase